MEKLDTIRVKVVRILLLFLWAHIPAVLVHGWWADSDQTIAILGGVAILSAAATLATRFASPPRVGRMVLAVAMVLTAGGLVAIYAGHPWQKDVHIYFATVLALLSSTFCWRTLAVSTVTTVAYFVLMTAFAPQYLYGATGDFLEAGFEVVAFLVLSAGLFWVTQLVQGLFAQVQNEHEVAITEAQKAQEATAMAKEAANNAETAASEALNAKRESDELRAQQSEQEAQAAAEKQALLEDIASRFEGSVQRIVQDVATMTNNLKSTVSKLQTQAKNGIQSAENIARVTENTSDNVATVSGAAHELSGATSEISVQVDQTNRLTGDAITQAAGVSSRIAVLSERADEIGSVVALITEIAEQTNLLALNATIEAARAGEVGKGFAVVATEVKNLAGESAKAADGIHDKIGAVQSATKAAVDAMDEIHEMIKSVNMGATAIAAAVEEQDAATRDIAQSVGHASQGARSAADNAKAVETEARQSEQATMDALESLEQLENLTSALTEQTDTFLSQVRGGPSGVRQLHVVGA